MNRVFYWLIAATLVFVSPVAMSQCGGDTCSVGAAGIGGQMSGGKAQGFHEEFVSTVRIPGAAITNSGNLDAGRLTVTLDGGSLGTVSGTFREHPDATTRGHGTGMFGDWAGQCEDPDFEGC